MYQYSTNWQAKHRRNNEEKPVVLKFLIDTPAGRMHGFNMLMPERSSEVQGTNEQDVAMEEAVGEEEKKDDMEVVPCRTCIESRHRSR